MRFSDLLYGEVKIPEWLIPFLKIPEFVRLRSVRLSNVDSYEFKDFNAPTRWEHSIGVVHLAITLAKRKKLSEKDAAHLLLASLLHDIATPPFAHTIEYVLADYDHELESYKILKANNSIDSNPSFPIFASQLPQFRNLCKVTSSKFKMKIDPDTVAEMVTGGGELGFLINGSVDLDNIDNVCRACIYLGIDVDRNVPVKVAEWLAGFNKIPSEFDIKENFYSSKWIGYKNLMYNKFYSSSEEELGRQAFLQHLIRRAHNEGLSRNSILWSTDEELLYKIENFPTKHVVENNGRMLHQLPSLKELVQRYRMLESPVKVIEIPVEDREFYNQIKNPLFSDWLERKMTTSTFEPFVLINSKRFNKQNLLFHEEIGIIQIYKLGGMELKKGQLPEMIQENLLGNNGSQNIQINRIVRDLVDVYQQTKPWMELSPRRKNNIKTNLDNVGNWSFRLSKNEALHSYPATFVHAIPASLITALELKGELILDPFGGTGQTAMEAIKLGCKAISSDSNSVAHLISKVKFQFLEQELIVKALSIRECDLEKFETSPQPSFDNIYKWHDDMTIDELCRIKTFIDLEPNLKLKDFYTLCFSDILTACTARKGKEHGYFADNTPLAKGELAPAYEPALKLFVSKIAKNIRIMEKSYSHFIRNGLDAREEISNGQVFQNDITISSFDDFGISENSVSAIITSPPYLCMADYTLGQRLTYNWLFPEHFKEDFGNEIGSRRSRMNKDLALSAYLNKMRLFARNSAKLLRKDGFLATVLGAPLANNYKEQSIISKLDEIFIEEGFELFWSTYRPISWHRNHGYARLKEERIAVHIKK